MKAFNGREFFQDKYPQNKKHEVILEDDGNYFDRADQPEEIWCGISQEEAKRITDFISNAQILGVDNNSVNAAYELRDMLKNVLR